MNAELGILVIHGMGSQEENFADEIIDELNDRVDDRGKDSSLIAWESVYWANILEPRQNQYWLDSKNSNNLDAVRLRKFMITAFGDASAYQKVDSPHNTTYEAIHAIIRTRVKSLYEIGLGTRPKPLIILAHSLGGHIMSNYIWDIQQKPNQRLSEFENMGYLAGMITFGCNIPLFTFSHSQLEPFSFPGEKLSRAEKSKAKWLNFYDADDVLGYPLRQLSNSYKKLVKDNHINSGGLLTSWNPLSHNGYWTDNDMTKPAAELIAKFI